MREILIKLIGVNPVQNAEGIFTSRTEPVVTPCWASRKSANRSEFYAASAVGETVDAVYEVSAIDYIPGVHTQIEDRGVRYDIIRSYRYEDNEAVELSARRRDI